MQKSLEETKKSFFRLVELIKQDYILASELGVEVGKDFKIYYDGDILGVNIWEVENRGYSPRDREIIAIKGVLCVDILDCLSYGYRDKMVGLREAYKAINKLRSDTEFYLASVFVSSKKETEAVEKSFKSYRDACAKVFFK